LFVCCGKCDWEEKPQKATYDNERRSRLSEAIKHSLPVFEKMPNTEELKKFFSTADGQGKIKKNYCCG
jgi:hypothetical protein